MKMAGVFEYDDFEPDWEPGEKFAAQTRVLRGVKWLTQNFPGWEERIDPQTLNMLDGSKCICGQVFDEEGASAGVYGYHYAQDHLFREANDWISRFVKAEKGSYARTVDVAITLGFDGGNLPKEKAKTKSDLYYISCGQLEAVWKAYLRARENKVDVK